MSCNRPVTAYYSAELTPEGKRGIVFTRRSRYLGSDPAYSRPITVPCGKCHGCKADQALMWSIRGYHESQEHEQNSFLTLTYADEHLPQDGKISVDHLQRFFKRVRKTTRIRYIACGEYGEKTRRPHYHAIIFGRDWLENSIPVTNDLYTHPDFARLWPYGHVSIAPVTMGSISYVCGYVNKKIGDTDTFNLMSRRPGIGRGYLDKYLSDMQRTGTVTIEGRELPIPPRYFAWAEEELGQVKMEKRRYAAEKFKRTDLYQRAEDERNREINRQSRHKSRQEKL